jgi:UDP-N-acetylmuramyl pentapeptide synthase
VIRPGDVILVKGSRGVRTDRVVERLKAEFA